VSQEEYLSLSPCFRPKTDIGGLETDFSGRRLSGGEETSYQISAEPVIQEVPTQTDPDLQVNIPHSLKDSSPQPFSSDKQTIYGEDVVDDHHMTEVPDNDDGKGVTLKCLLNSTPEPDSACGSYSKTGKFPNSTKLTTISVITGRKVDSVAPQPQTDSSTSPVFVTLVCSDPLFKAKLQTRPGKPISKVIKKFAKLLRLSPSSLNCKVDNVRLTGQELTGGLAGVVINVEKNIQVKS